MVPSDLSAEVEAIKATITRYFPVYDTRVSQEAVTFFISTDQATLERKFDDLRIEMSKARYAPVLAKQGGEHTISVVRKPQPVRRHIWINLVLLGVTFITTVLAGALLWSGYVQSAGLWTADNLLWGAVFFAVPLMTILGVHELSHYLVSRRFKVDASLPYFIPSIPPFGTFGAFISMRDPMPSRRALVEIGAAGPLAGFLVTIPVAIVGMILTGQGPVHADYGSGGQLITNFPLIYQFIASLIPISGNVFLHPMAFAAWVGFFVTAINLLPAGQLDGGHIARGLLGDNAKYLAYVTMGALFLLGFFVYTSWLLFGILIVFLGIRHPAPLNDISLPDPKRLAVGAVAFLVLLGSFVFVPLEVISPSYTFEATSSDNFNATIAPGGTGMIHVNLTDTGNLNISVTITVSGIPQGWSAAVYPENASPVNATNTLATNITFGTTMPYLVEVRVPASEPTGTRILELRATSTDTLVSQQLTISVA
jgi:membrane-associated protease RseP (regulator of RpoE activity)